MQCVQSVSLYRGIGLAQQMQTQSSHGSMGDNNAKEAITAFNNWLFVIFDCCEADCVSWRRRGAGPSLRRDDGRVGELLG